MGILQKLFGDANKKYVDSLASTVSAINNLEKEFELLTDEEIKAKSLDLKKQVQAGTSLDDILVQLLPWSEKQPSAH